MKVTNARWIVLIISFFVLTFGGVAGLDLGSFLPTFACPFVGQTKGGDCFFWSVQKLMIRGNWESYKKLGEYFFYFSLLVIILGKAWCGWICPLGFIQDVLDLIRRKFHFGPVRFSERLRARLAVIKWAFLFIALLVPLWVAFPFLGKSVAWDFKMLFCKLCPGRYICPLVIGNSSTFMIKFGSPVAMPMFTLGLIFSFVTIVGSLVKRRFWCSYCPMSLLLSFYRKISFLKLKKDPQKCTRCGICYNVCPMEIKEVYQERKRENVTFGDCILCFQCVENCPEDGALQATFLGKTIYKSSQKKFFSRIFSSSQKRIKGKVSDKNKEIKQKELITGYAK